MGVLTWLFGGLLVGWVARFLVRGNRHLGCLGTIGLGVLGSLVGGTLGNVISGDGFDVAYAGFLGSVVGAVLILMITARMSSSRSDQQAH